MSRQTIAEFKSSQGVSELGFRKSHTTERYIASFVDSNGVEIKLITKADFNPKETAYVVPNDLDQYEVDYWVSNSAGSAPDFVL